MKSIIGKIKCEAALLEPNRGRIKANNTIFEYLVINNSYSSAACFGRIASNILLPSKG